MGSVIVACIAGVVTLVARFSGWVEALVVSKLGISDSVELARAEGRLGKQRAVELLGSGALVSLEPGTYESLARS